MKVLSVMGTRPEAIKMACVVRALGSTPGVQSRTLVTAQHRQMLDQILELFRIMPDHDLDLMRPGQTLTGVTTQVLEGVGHVLAQEKPDWVLVQGDTTTAMAATIAAFYAGIPVGHVEAGLRTYDLARPYPEEGNRRITGVLARLHFAPTAWAAGNLRREGVAPDAIRVTGNTVIDSFHAVAAMPSSTEDDLLKIQAPHMVVVTCHRRENFGRPLQDICRAIRDLVDLEADVHVVMPVHPNPNVHGHVHDALSGHERITLTPPLGYQSLVHLLNRCSFLITDSGGLQEEATGVGKPVLVLRTGTERPEGVRAGSALLVGSDYEAIVGHSRRLVNDLDFHASMARVTSPYGDGRAAQRIVEALLPERVVDLNALEDQLHETAAQSVRS